MNNKYYKMRQYRSEDGGVTWIPTEVYTAGALIERGSIACNPIERWVEDGWMCDNCPESMYRTISGVPYCSGTYDVDRYVEVAEQVSYDGGMTWETTASTDVLVEEKSYDCGYRERTTSGTPYCNGVDKYQDVYNQVSYDGGTYWETTATTNVLIEAQSTDCGYVPPQYRTISGVPYCSGTYDVDKYIEVDDQVSYDGGVTWETTASTDVLVEEKSYDCGYRERTTSGTPYCVGYDKYEDVYDQVSYDGGTYWETTATTNVLIEAQSTDCGYVPPTPTFDGKWLAYRGGTVTSSAECDSTSAITYGEIANPLYSVVIGDCVTSIGASAFTQANRLSSVTISNSVTSIGTSAFYGCSSLTSVTIPNSVTSIGYGAFQGCRRLTTCTIGNSVSSISSYAFSGCTSLSSITIPNSVTTIGIGAFQGCSGLTSIGIPDSVTSISSGMCSGCRSLTSVTIPSGVTSIGNYAFSDCRGLTSIYIPDSVTSIGAWAFYDCYSLSSVNIPSGVTSINNYTFSDCRGLTSITIPSGVTSIGMDAFSDCSGLTAITCNAITPPALGTYALVNTNNCPIYVPCQSIDAYKSAWSAYASRIEGIPPCGEPSSYKWLATYSDSHTESAECDSSSAITNGEIDPENLVTVEIGDCVANIDYSAFEYYTSLSSVTIPDSVTSIDEYAFEYCSGLTNVTIGSGITSIGNYAFGRCRRLTSITVEATTPPSLGDNVFYNTNDCPIYVPAASVSAYQSAWSDYASRIQAIP